MQSSWKRIVPCLALGVLVLAAGCGKKGEAPTPASIGGGGTGSTESGIDQGGLAGTAVKDALHPTVVLDTSLGSVTVELDGEKAPLTVDNFLSYVDRGEYDQTIFHQVLKDYPKVILGGAYGPDLTEKPCQPTARNEAHNGLRNQRGTIAMARQADVIDSATRHFFFNLTDNAVLDHQSQAPDAQTLDPGAYGYCVFGNVVSGQEVLDKIAEVEVQDNGNLEQIPVQTVLINSIRRVKPR